MADQFALDESHLIVDLDYLILNQPALKVIILITVPLAAHELALVPLELHEGGEHAGLAVGFLREQFGEFVLELFDLG